MAKKKASASARAGVADPQTQSSQEATSAPKADIYQGRWVEVNGMKVPVADERPPYDFLGGAPSGVTERLRPIDAASSGDAELWAAEVALHEATAELQHVLTQTIVRAKDIKERAAENREVEKAKDDVARKQEARDAAWATAERTASVPETIAVPTDAGAVEPINGLTKARRRQDVLATVLKTIVDERKTARILDIWPYLRGLGREATARTGLARAVTSTAHPLNQVIGFDEIKNLVRWRDANGREKETNREAVRRRLTRNCL